MKFDIQHRPSYALAIVHLEAGETVIAEGGALVSRDANISMETRAGKDKGGGLMKGLMSGLKRMVAGESFFQNRFTASQPGHNLGWVQRQISETHTGGLVNRLGNSWHRRHNRHFAHALHAKGMKWVWHLNDNRVNKG